jgi:hypothetical protein
MAELFGKDRMVITKHITNIFGEGELLGFAMYKLVQKRCESFVHGFLYSKL